MDGMLRCLTDLTSGRTHLNVYVLDAPVLIMSALCVRAKQLGLQSLTHRSSGTLPTGTRPSGGPTHGLWLMLQLLILSH